jgi:hypothetical protein
MARRMALERQQHRFAAGIGRAGCLASVVPAACRPLCGG